MWAKLHLQIVRERWMDRRRDVGDRRERGAVGGRQGKIRKNGRRKAMNKCNLEEKIKSLMRTVSRESASDVQREGRRNGGMKKTESSHREGGGKA